MLSQSRWPLLTMLLTHCGDSSVAVSDSPDTATHDAGVRRDALVDGAGDAAGGEHPDALVADASVPGARDAAYVEVPFGPALSANPWSAGGGFATQHGDTGASDTSPLPGPGMAGVTIAALDLLAACPTLLPRSDGLLLAVCTQIANQTPAVFLIDPRTLTPLTSRPLTKGDLFGGVYPYLDQAERVVVVDGANDLLRVAATKAGPWALTVDEQVALGPAMSEHCGSATCDSVVGLAPDYQGRVWFASASGLVGTVRDGVRTLALPEGERVANSIATAPEGTAVVTDHALYLLVARDDGTPEIKLRASYDRGSARKPGQLSWGSGSTPTFFGPRTGSEYLAITDNARPTMNLVVYRSDGSPKPVCTFAVPSPAGDGSENSPIGAGRSVFVASTFGYPYAALPANAGASVPESAAVQGGMARIDITPDERCVLRWTNAVRSAAVPKLSLADTRIYTTERRPLFPNANSQLDAMAFDVIDPETGALLSSQDLASASDTMQLAGTVGANRTFYQGTITGLLRITPAQP
jgi:hypothetical protein